MNFLKELQQYAAKAMWGLVLAVVLASLTGGVVFFAATNSVVYVSRPDKGFIASVDFTFLGTIPVASNLDSPQGLTCGPDGNLYVSLPFDGQIIRMDQFGQQKRTIMSRTDLAPFDLQFDANGDLYFSTRENISASQQGVWRISQANPRNEPEQVLPASAFGGSAALDEIFFLHSGPFAGDLLIVNGDRSQVLRAAAPDFSEATVLLSSDDGLQFPIGVVQASNGDVLVSDFDRGEILRFGADGGATQGGSNITQINAANRLAIDSDDTLYVSAKSFGRSGGGVIRISPGGVRTVISIPDAFDLTICE